MTHTPGPWEALLDKPKAKPMGMYMPRAVAMISAIPAMKRSTIQLARG